MNPALDPSAALAAQPAAGGASSALAPAAAGAGDPLAQLHGLHLPDAIGFWPPAPGWWMVAGLVALAIVGLALWTRARRRSVARHALRELDRLARSQDGADLQLLATSISALLRRVALLRFGRARVAGLHGRAWQDFLSETTARSRSRKRFVPDAGLLLSLAPYAPAGAACLTRDGGGLDAGGLIGAARAWIKENA